MCFFSFCFTSYQAHVPVSLQTLKWCGSLLSNNEAPSSWVIQIHWELCLPGTLDEALGCASPWQDGPWDTQRLVDWDWCVVLSTVCLSWHHVPSATSVPFLLLVPIVLSSWQMGEDSKEEEGGKDRRWLKFTGPLYDTDRWWPGSYFLKHSFMVRVRGGCALQTPELDTKHPHPN